jgi:hypothetical protein
MTRSGRHRTAVVRLTSLAAAVTTLIGVVWLPRDGTTAAELVVMLTAAAVLTGGVVAAAWWAR